MKSYDEFGIDYKPLVLIVDDIPENLQILGKTLELRGYKISLATNGQDAIAIADYTKPDIILLDILMPAMNGFEVCTILKSNPNTKDIPVIFLTAKANKEDLLKGFETGATDYITKPFNIHEVIARVETHLELKLMRDSREIFIQKLIESNDKLNKAEAELKELNSGKNMFFSIIAHDLKNPFQGFIGLTEALNNEYDDLSRDEIIEMASSMNKSARKLNELLENLLTWSKMEQGKIQIKLEEINLHSTVEDIFTIFIQNAKDKGIELINSIPKDLILKTDKNVIQTVIRNIISNAIKYSNKEGKVTVFQELNDNFIILSIQDHGIGMTTQELNNLFNYNILYIDDKSYTDHGSGLGLSMSKELIERIGGKLIVHSHLNEGSTIKIILPK